MQVITNETKRVPMLSTREAAVLMGIHPQCIEHYIQRGVLTPGIGTVAGRKVRLFRADEVKRVIEARRVLKYDKGLRRGRKPVSGLDHVAEVLANDLASKPYAVEALHELRDADPKLNSPRAETRETEQGAEDSVSVQAAL